MEEVLLDEIDALTAEKGAPKTICNQPHPEVDLFTEELRAAGFESYANLDAFKFRKRHECSLWVRRADGRCVPELYALAVLKFGSLKGRKPYWTDGSPNNNTMDNVSVAEPLKRDIYRLKNTKKIPWNDPVGRATHRVAAKKWAKKNKEIVELARAQLPSSLMDEINKTYNLPERGPTDDDVNPPETAREIMARIEREMIEEKRKKGAEQGELP